MKSDFLAIEDKPNIDDDKLRYVMFVRTYNEAREHEEINGHTPSDISTKINYIR